MSSKSYMEVCVNAEDGSEHIYWVKLTNMPRHEDAVDWSIERAISYHLKVGGAPIATQSDDFEPVTAYEPFSRIREEYIVI